MFSQKTKIQICAKNLAGVEHDLTTIDFTGLDLVGAVNDGTPPVIGDTTVTVDGFTTNIPTGCIIGFAGDDTTYYVSTGASSTSITIDPPLRTNLADNQAVTIYPHFDISQYVTSVSNLSQRAEYNQAELIFDKPISYTLFNKNSVFYDRDTHSTGWGLTTAYFSTYNAQSDTDNQYVRISINRNSTWYQKYCGKIVRYSFELDEINRSISFDTESVFYSLKDIRLFEVPEIFNCHKYTSTSRKTKTVSGQYVEIIRKIFQHPQIGVRQKSYTVTNKLKSNHTCTLTIGTHSVQVGELISVDIDDVNFDTRNAIVTAVASTTVSYVLKIYTYEEGTITPAATAGDGIVYPAAASGAGTTQGGYEDEFRIKFSGHSTIYNSSYFTVGGTRIEVDPVLTSNVANNEAYIMTYPTDVASTAISKANGLTSQGVVFDTATKYFDVTHQNWSYDIIDCFFIVQKWMKNTIEQDTCFNIINDFCIKFGAIVCIDYINGSPMAFFRSRVNASSSKKTLDSGDFINNLNIGGNWKFVSPNGVSVDSTIEYFNGTTLETAFKFTDAADEQNFTSKIHTKGDVNIYTDDTLPSAGDIVIFRGDSNRYRVSSVGSGYFTLLRGIEIDQKKNTPFWVEANLNQSISYANAFNIKLKYPDVYCGGDDLYRLYNDGDMHSISFYTLDYTTSDSSGYGFASISIVPLIPIQISCSNPLSKSIVCGVSNLFNGVGFIKHYSILGEENQIQTIYTGGATTDIWRICAGLQEIFNFDTNTLSCNLICGISGATSGSKYRLMASMLDNGTTNAKTAKVDGADLVGSTSINYTDATGTIYVGDFIKFNAHDTIYYVTDRTSSNMTITPALTSATSNRETIFVKGSNFKISNLRNDGTLTTSLGSWNMAFHNGDVLNPDYNDYVYFTGDTTIKQIGFIDIEYGYALSGTLATIVGNTHKGIHSQAGENTSYQNIYVCENTNDEIIVNDDSTFSTYVTLCGGGATSPTKTARTADLSLSNPNDVKKAYDNMVYIADTGNDKLIINDVATGYSYCIAVLADVSNPQSVDIDNFVQTWNITNGVVDVCFNASKLAYKFYSKNRRILECSVRDADMGYIDYTLFDRFTVDSSILSAASGSPQFYVYAYDFNWETHDQKLTLLESVE